MGTYQNTTNRGYQKPHPSNTLAEDVDRLRSALDAIDADVAARATVASPTFTGTPAAPTPAAGTNTTQIATTAFVRSEVAALVAGAPAALDTLDELAAALADDANYAATVNTALANRYTKAEADARFVQGAVQAVFPQGTALVFAQTAAPTGWTKSTTHNDKALRVVSGTAGSGGTTAFSSVFTSRTASGTVGATTLTIFQMPSHDHTANLVTGGASASGIGTGTQFKLATGNTSFTGGGGSHSHSFTGTAMDFDVQYVDVIIATKD